MKVSVSTIEKIRIDDIMGSPHRLDPVDAIFEDVGQRQGKVTISCYGESWTAYWGGMGDRTVKEFFLSCDQHYLAGKLSSIDSDLPDFEALPNMARKEVIKKRKSRDIFKSVARSLYNECERLEGVEMSRDIDNDLCERIFECQWYELSVPTKINPKYEYLCRIINAVKEALKTTQPQQAEAA